MLLKLIFYGLVCSIAEGQRRMTMSALSQGIYSRKVGSFVKGDSIGNFGVNLGSAPSYRLSDGSVGVGFDRFGNARGKDFANITGFGIGFVNNNVVQIGANGTAEGTNVRTIQSYEGFAHQNHTNITNHLYSQAVGQNRSSAKLNTKVGLIRNEQTSNTSVKNAEGEAKGTGSLATNSEVMLRQTLSWINAFTEFVSRSSGKGFGDASAKTNLRYETNLHKIDGNGFIKGSNSNNGTVNTDVEVTGQVDGNHHKVNSDGFASIVGSGLSQFVSVSNLEYNKTGNHSNLISSADGSILSDETNKIILNTNNSIENGGFFGVNGTSNGKTQDMFLQSAFHGNSGDAVEYLGKGNGHIKSEGTKKSKSTIDLFSKYKSNGNAFFNILSRGSSKSQKNVSTLNMRTNAHFGNSKGLFQGATGESMGMGLGEFSRLNGANSLNADGFENHGNALMEGKAYGKNKSSLVTRSNIFFVDSDGKQRNATAQGNVDTIGNDTSAYSLSVASNNNDNGYMINYQNATSKGSKYSGFTLSNLAFLKRRKRSAMSRNVDKISTNS